MVWFHKTVSFVTSRGPVSFSRRKLCHVVSSYLVCLCVYICYKVTWRNQSKWITQAYFDTNNSCISCSIQKMMLFYLNQTRYVTEFHITSFAMSSVTWYHNPHPKSVHKHLRSDNNIMSCHVMTESVKYQIDIIWFRYRWFTLQVCIKYDMSRPFTYKYLRNR